MSVRTERKTECEYLAAHIRIITTSGMCELDKVCSTCDCFNPELQDELARRTACDLVQILGLHWEEIRGESGAMYKRLVSRIEDT